MKCKGRIILVLVLTVIASCMATRFSNVWVDETYKKGPLKNILVIAILPSPEKSKMVEDEMARQLKTRGANTVLGYLEFPGKPPGREDVVSRLGKLSVDAVLITKLSGRETKSYQAYPDDYKTVLREWEEPGSGRLAAQPQLVGDDPQSYALMSTDLYDVNTQKIVWSALTETWIVGTDSRLTSSFVSTVIKKLADDKMIR